jgi:hypothetical protein
MWLQVVVGIGWFIWLSSGTAGLKDGLTVGAFLVMGFGLKNLLDTFWKEKQAEKQESRGADLEEAQPSRFSRVKKGSLPSPNWNASRSGGSGEPSVLRRFERRLADPRV